MWKGHEQSNNTHKFGQFHKMNQEGSAADEQYGALWNGSTAMLAEIYLLRLEAKIRVEEPAKSPTRDPRIVPAKLPTK